MGLDLAEQINQQMCFALPKANDAGSIARTLVLLFTPGASNAKEQLESFLASRFSDKNAVRLADITNGAQVIAELVVRSESIVRFRNTPIVIMYVAAMGEEFSFLDCQNHYTAQTVRVYRRESEIHRNEPDALFVRGSSDGICSLAYLIYLQAYFVNVPAPIGGGVLESWTARLTFDEWVHRLYCQLSADLRGIPADEDLVRKQIAEQAERCCKTFLQKMKKAPALTQYPIDADGLDEIGAELPNFFQRLFGKGIRIQLKKVLARLYGKAEDGQPQALYFHELFFGEQNMDGLFKRFWQNPEAWYYQMPIIQLEDLLVAVLSERSTASQDIYEAKLKELQDTRLSDHISIDGRKIQDIMSALIPWEKNAQRLYRVYAEAWFWKKALADATEGHLQHSMAKAKRRIESQQEFLCNCNVRQETEHEQQFLANWGQDIAERARQYRPLDADWTYETLEQAINPGCLLPSVRRADYKPKLYGFLRCENNQERIKIPSIFFGAVGTAEWNFISDTALRGIAVVVAVAPTAIYTLGNGGKTCD